MSKRPINVEIRPRGNESIERMLKKFSRKVKKEKILEQYRDRMYYEKPSDQKRRQEKQRRNVLNKLKNKEETN
jgi:ribosomal protein S21